MHFIDAIKNPALSEADLLPLMPADSNAFLEYDHRTGLTALHYAVYEGRRETLRAMLVRSRSDKTDDRDFQEALSKYDWSKNRLISKDLQSHSSAFQLCLEQQRYDLAEIFIQNGLSPNVLKGYLETVLINSMHHVISFCFLSRERSCRNTSAFDDRLARFEKFLSDIEYLTSHLHDYEPSADMPGVKNWLRPMSERYRYEDFPDAVPASCIYRSGYPGGDLRNDATRTSANALQEKYGDRRLTMQDTLDLAEDFLNYSKADYERSIYDMDRRRADSRGGPYPENARYFDEALAIYRAFKNKTALQQALNSATAIDAVQSCIQEWKDINAHELGNAALTGPQLLAIKEMSEKARQGGKHELAYTLLTIIMAETSPHLPGGSAIANVVGGFSAARQAVAQRGGSAAASSGAGAGLAQP
jgi:hypothetical protein